MNQVSIIQCEDYQQERVDAAVRRSIELLGGIERYIRPGMKVLLKCNLLMRKRPEECTTTHPAVVEAVAKLLLEAGAVPIIGDSPAGLFTEGALRGIYHITGMKEVAERTGAQLNYDTGIAEVENPEGKLVKRLTIANVVKEVDAVISLCKLKTHGMTLFTGAVKNLFGVIPGMAKAEYHLRMKKLEDFSDMLLDICVYVKPVLSIMDGIIGMEGHGPSAGDPRKIGVILASDSPYALDLAAASLVGISPERVSTIRLAEKRGLCSSKLEDVLLLGDSFDQLRITDFKLPETGRVNFIERFFNSENRFVEFLNYYLGPRPVFDHTHCIGCRDCERSCPPKAIKMVNGRPQVNLRKCIRCYCCQELCPKKTVHIKRNWFFRMIK